jgi:hypothetical protein
MLDETTFAMLGTAIAHWRLVIANVIKIRADFGAMAGAMKLPAFLGCLIRQ